MKKFTSIANMLIISLTISCSGKIFPDEKFSLSKKYSDLIKPYKVGDTLLFQNKLHDIETFIITSYDSIMSNQSNWAIEQRPFKEVSVTYNPLPLRQWKDAVDKGTGDNGVNNVVMADDELMTIHITPDNRMQSCYISLKNFQGFIKDSSRVNNVPLVANNITLEHYYSVANRAPDLVKDSSGIRTGFYCKR